jgi:drug/metabolite transporter, DME family
VSAPHDPGYARGVLLVGFAGALASFNGLIFRLVESAADWQVVFWRSFSMFCAVTLMLLWRARGRLGTVVRAAGVPALIGGAFMGLSNIAFSMSVLHTTVANALFILSASPFIVAVFARLLLGEVIPRVTVIAFVLAMAGVGVMVQEGLASGKLLGNLFAVAAATTFSLFVIVMRWRRGVDNLPALVVAGAVGAAITFVIAGDVAVSAHDLALLSFMGVGIVALGFWLYTVGARHVPAAQVALLALTEVVFGPIWVLLFVGEKPSTTTLVGGAFVFAAILGQTFWGLRRPA